MTPEASQAQAAARLLLSVIAWAVRDDDAEFVVASPVFDIYCKLLGLGNDSIFEFRQRYLRGQLDPTALDDRCLERLRNGREQPGDPVLWQSWAAMPEWR